MSETEPLLVLCTAPTDSEVIKRLARGLVSERLAACVNVIPGITSTYRWEGTVEESSEAQLIIKTEAGRFGALAEWLNQHHPYETPEILALPIVSGTPAYLEWLSAAVTPADDA